MSANTRRMKCAHKTPTRLHTLSNAQPRPRCHARPHAKHAQARSRARAKVGYKKTGPDCVLNCMSFSKPNLVSASAASAQMVAHLSRFA
jgi:hypothetical protein